MVGAEIFDDRFRFGWSQSDAIQPDHALQGFFPLFGRGAFPGNPRKVPVRVLGVATAALCEHHWIRNRNALFGCGLGRIRRGSWLSIAMARPQQQRG